MNTVTERGQVLRLLRVERTVADLPAAAAFYRERLGFVDDSAAGDDPFAGHGMTTARLRLGDQRLWLTTDESKGAPYPINSTAADLWFQHIAIVTKDMDGAYARLGLAEPISTTGPVLLPPAAGSVIAYKFCDPDNHPLELIYFPKGEGPDRWHQIDSSKPTLGIDHSAISVADPDISIAFYRDLLGMKLGARQTNHGPAQEKLDALAGDTVEVIALQPAQHATPHLELLAYRHPRGRRLHEPPTPRDIAGDRLVFTVSGLSDIIKRIDERMIVQISSGGLPAALLLDPDGHLFVLIEDQEQPRKSSH